MADPKLKGIRNGNCNRTACQAPGATFWHTGTKAYYCPVCARDINELCRRDALNMYGISVLLVDPNAVSPAMRAAFEAKGITVPEAL